MHIAVQYGKSFVFIDIAGCINSSLCSSFVFNNISGYPCKGIIPIPQASLSPRIRTLFMVRFWLVSRISAKSLYFHEYRGFHGRFHESRCPFWFVFGAPLLIQEGRRNERRGVVTGLGWFKAGCIRNSGVARRGHTRPVASILRLFILSTEKRLQ